MVFCTKSLYPATLHRWMGLGSSRSIARRLFWIFRLTIFTGLPDAQKKYLFKVQLKLMENPETRKCGQHVDRLKVYPPPATMSPPRPFPFKPFFCETNAPRQPFEIAINQPDFDFDFVNPIITKYNIYLETTLDSWRNFTWSYVVYLLVTVEDIYLYIIICAICMNLYLLWWILRGLWNVWSWSVQVPGIFRLPSALVNSAKMSRMAVMCLHDPVGPWPAGHSQCAFSMLTEVLLLTLNLKL